MDADGLNRSLEVIELKESLGADWDEFVLKHPEATFFHLSHWKKVIEASFGHHCHFLCARSNEDILGILPLVHIQSPLFGRALISTAFCVYGGALVIDDQARSELEAAALELGRRLDVDYLEVRLRAPRHDDWMRNDQLYVTFRKDIHRDPDENLAAIPRKQRAMVRKGIRQGLKSEIDTDIDRFYGLYAESVRNLGTPVFAKKYFSNLKAIFGDSCEILTVVHGGQPVSSVMSFYFRDEVLPYYGGGSMHARELAANDFMYWEVMRRASEKGCGTYDFGRSKKGTGSFAFKTHWGFSPEPLSYEFKLLRGHALPSVNPTNPKFRAAIALWKRLPLAVANRIGPLIARDLG